MSDPEARTPRPAVVPIERGAGQVDSGDLGARAREVHRVGAEAAANFQHPLAAQRSNCAKPGNMRLDEVLPRLDLIEITRVPTGSVECLRLHGRRFQYFANLVDRTVAERRVLGCNALSCRVGGDAEFGIRAVCTARRQQQQRDVRREPDLLDALRLKQCRAIRQTTSVSSRSPDDGSATRRHPVARNR